MGDKESLELSEEADIHLKCPRLYLKPDQSNTTCLKLSKLDCNPSLNIECCEGAEVSVKRGNHDAFICPCGTYEHDNLTHNLNIDQMFIEHNVKKEENFNNDKNGKIEDALIVHDNLNSFKTTKKNKNNLS